MSIIAQKSFLTFCVSLLVVGAFIASADQSAADNTDDGTNIIYVDDGNCKYSVDLYHLQDASQSYEDDIQNLREQLQDLFSEVNELYPGSRLGVSTFVDKPHHNCPDVGYCWKNLAPLGSSVEDCRKRLLEETFSPLGGGDQPENPLGAMIRAALSPKVGWNTENVDPSTGLPVRRIMILSTDNPPHTLDYFNRERQITSKDDTGRDTSCEWPEYGNFFDVVNETSLAEDDNVGCEVVDFPSWDQWARVMRQKKIIPVFLVGDWSYTVGNRKFYPKYYHDYFLKDPVLKNCCDNIDGLLPFYQVMMQRYNVHGLAAPVSVDGSDVKDVAMSLLKDLPKLICRDPTTTTTTPTTTTPTTTTGTTTTKPTTAGTTTTAAAAGGGFPGAVIGGATAGVAAAAAAGILYAKKVGLTLPFQRTPDASTAIEQAVDTPESPMEREVFESVTADMFT